jgi:hypothetical protein
MRLIALALPQWSTAAIIIANGEAFDIPLRLILDRRRARAGSPSQDQAFFL